VSELPQLARDALGRFANVAWGNLDYAWTLPISSPYGPRVHPVTGETHLHTGVDFPLPTGTPVIAVWNGIVTKTYRVGIDEKAQINGNTVFLRCGVFTFAYLHLSRIDVEPGMSVLQGQRLGLSGATGRVTGPHLHFQAQIGPATFDPMLLFPSWGR
jgi:murein DD-endopeptidase MepM/ murein hydrolase activator NlpD